MMASRKLPYGEGTIYQRKDGMWCSSFSLPTHDGGRRRRVVYAKTEAAVRAKLIAEKRRLAKSGDIPTGSPTLTTWLNRWYQDVAVRKVRPKTAATYRSIIDRHIIPSIGKVRLDRLTIQHVSKLAADINAKGLSSTTALQAHRILAVALKYAERDGRVVKNIATIADAPRKAATKLNVLDLNEASTVLKEAARETSPGVPADPFGLLWWAVLLTGARQGELLGLEQDRVSDTLELSWQLQRLTWQHGCGVKGDVWPCNRKRGTDCPDRKLDAPADWEHRHVTGGLWLARPKSRAGWRTIPLVDPLRTVLTKQAELTSQKPNPHNLMWTMPDGSPIDPRVESEAWHALLQRAAVTDTRLHDARHATVDLLLEAGVPIEVVQDIVGHSTRAMTMEYRSKSARPAHTAAMQALAQLLSPSPDLTPTWGGQQT